jgi:hypothetical protein
MIPQGIVVTGDHRRCEVLVRNPESLNGGTPESVRDPLGDLLRRIMRTMETVAELRGAHLAMNS